MAKLELAVGSILVFYLGALLTMLISHTISVITQYKQYTLLKRIISMTILKPTLRARRLKDQSNIN